MNFSNKNYEQKIINIKRVSKKIMLSIVFVFASFAMVNANSSVVEKVESDEDCGEVAMAAGYGAHLAEMDDDEIFFYMNVAYALCEGYTYEEIMEAGNMG